MTVVIQVPGRFGDDWESARESWEMDLEGGSDAGMTPARAEAARSALAKYAAGTWVKRGKGDTMTLTLTLEEAKWFRGEALYRYEFNGGNNNPYGCEDPDPSDRRAAKVLLDRLDAAIAAEMREAG